MGQSISIELRWGEEATVRGRGEVAAKLQMPVSLCFKSLQMAQVHDADPARFEEHPTQSPGGASKESKFCSACGQRQEATSKCVEATRKFCLAVRQGDVSVCGSTFVVV